MVKRLVVVPRPASSGGDIRRRLAEVALGQWKAERSDCAGASAFRAMRGHGLDDLFGESDGAATIVAADARCASVLYGAYEILQLGGELVARPAAIESQGLEMTGELVASETGAIAHACGLACGLDASL